PPPEGGSIGQPPAEIRKTPTGTCRSPRLNVTGAFRAAAHGRGAESTRREANSMPDFAQPAPDPAATAAFVPTPAGEAAGWPAIPGYEVLGELGQGGMGVVYRCRHVALGRTLAVKV